MQSSKADSVRLYKTRKVISELSSKEGRGTELVSLYIPPKKPIHEAISYLKNEWGTAANIKSDTTRNHVQDALTKTMQRLKLYRETPENGLVIFAGALPTNGPGSEVVRLNEIIPPKPVHTFLYTCVAPETNILMDDGTEKTIAALNSSWTREGVMSWSAEKRRLVGSSIREYLSIPVGRRKTYRLTVESGRSILATEDHPFMTPRGWVRLGELKKGDIVCILPLADMGVKHPTEHQESEKVILDEESLRKVPYPPKNMSLTLRRLKERGLLPLTSQNPKLVLLARILGHLLSDGSMAHIIEERSSGPYSYFTSDLCVASEADEAELRNDLARLGYELPEGREVTYTMNVEGRTYTSRVRHAKLRDVAICTLLRALGAPVGAKVKNGTRIPAWLMESSLTVQREFLAAYLGGDGIVPRVVKRNLVGRAGVEFHRTTREKKSGLMFARQLRSLLSNFGVTVNAIEFSRGYRRKDGFNTVGISLRFKLTEENIVRLCHGIGIKYCSRKAARVSLVGEYLRIKSRLREENRKKMTRARQLSAEGVPTDQIGELLMVTQRRTSQWIRGNVQSPTVKSTQLPSFDEWSRLARTDLDEPLLWEGVVSIENEAIPEVRDLTVSDGSHSFVANGFLVHNCDDHFHVEYLRDMLKEDKVYGILAIDSSETGLGVLSGDSLEVVDVMTSGISGKTRKGGQCVSSDTIVQMEDGRLVPISSTSPRSRIASYNFLNYSIGTYQIADTFTLVPREYYEVVSERPMMNISVTGEHRFFALSGDGVTTVEASRLEPGDKILVSRRVPESVDPVLDTRLPAEYTYFVSSEGRKLLKDLRRQRTLSQTEVAGAIGLCQTEISQLERGERDLKWEKLRKIIRFLHRDVDGFLTKYVEVKRTLPEHFTNELLQLLGYIAGDGNVGGNRVVLYEYRIGVAKTYANLAKLVLGLEYVPIKDVNKRHQPGSFARHRYHETRIYCKVFADALRQHYSGLISTKLREIPEQIHRLDNAHLARFLRGLFDAEGNVRKGRRIGIIMKSGLLIMQLQLLLLRFGIVSSYSTHVNRYGSTMHGLDISDHGSLETFYHQIGFSADDKLERLRRGLEKKHAHSYLSIPVVGSSVDMRAKELGIRRKQFQGITNFFRDQRGISRQVFRRVVQTFEEELTLARNSKAPTSRLELLEDTVSRLSMVERSELLLVRVKKVQLVKNTSQKRFIDIELPSTRSFIGNGFVLHNSARRYERAREMELTYFFNRVGEHTVRAFVNSAKVSGIIIGGPGYTKEEFIKGGYLHYQLQQNILAVIDTAYSGREGVREIVEKASDVLQDVRFVEEKKLVQRFLSEVNKPNGLAIYGLPRVMAALNKANVEIVLVSDDVNTTKIGMTCKNCKTPKEETVSSQKRMQIMQEMISTPCTKCGSSDYDIEEVDVVDVLEEKAIQIGAKVEVISGGTEEGNMFKSFGGVAAFVRYRA